MPDFVINDLVLPGPKIQWDGVSLEVVAPDMFCSSDDYNALRDASNSLRSFVKTGLSAGTYNLATLIVDADGRITGVAAGTGLTDGDKGDIVVSGSGSVFTIDGHAVTPAKMNQAAATTFLGNPTGGTADRQDMSAATAKTALAIATSDVSGLSAALALKADITSLDDVAFSGDAGQLQAGTLLAARMPALTGAVTTTVGTVSTVLANDAVATVNVLNDAVTNAKLADMAASTIKACIAGGDPIDATVTQILSMLGVGFGQFGNAADGANITFDGSTAVTGYSLAAGNYMAQRTCQFGNVTVSSGVTVFQHSVPGPFVRGTLTGPGKISWSGNNASGVTGGAAPTAVGPLIIGATAGNGGIANTNGGTGGNSNTAPQGFSATTAPGGVGAIGTPTAGTAGGTGHGGGGGASLANGGAGGPITLVANTNGWWEVKESAATGILPGSTGSPVKMTGPSAGGGGAGGGTSVGGGGGGGASWGALWVFHFDTGSLIVLEAKGGNGANAATESGVNQAGGGGGGGGAGGVIIVVTADPSPPYSSSSAATACAKGVHGNGAAGGPGGQAGTNGGDGGDGLFRVYN